MKSFLTKLILRSAFAGGLWIVGVQLLLPPLFTSNFLFKSNFVFKSSLVSKQVAHAAELSEIQARGYLTVGIKDNRAPLGFIDAAGEFAGFEIDIAARLAEELLGDRTALRLIPIANTNRLNALMDDEVDVVIAALTITPARRRLINFSDPYYLDGAAFITRRPNLRSLRDLGLAKIAILDGSSTVPRVRYILPGAELVGVASYREGQALLSQGVVDAFAGDVSVLASWINAEAAGSSTYRILPSIVSAEPLAIALPKGTQHNPLKAEINRALRRWYAEGWLQERAAFWGLPSETSQFIDLGPAPPETTIPVELSE